MIDHFQLSRVIVFGAGASHGCGDVFPHPPPLGKDLYGRLVGAYPNSWGALPSDLAHEFGCDFEVGMDLVWKRGSLFSAGLLRELGLYFASFVPATSTGTAYRRFVRRLRHRGKNDVLLSTLNYDCLIDGELSRLGDVNYHFPPGRGISLLKLHGSCNWFIDFAGGKYVDFSSDIRIQAPLFSLNTLSGVIDRLTVDNSFHPVMCIYNPTKDAPLAPNFFENMHADWQKHVLAASHVALVGVRPSPSDHHIWDPLAETPARLMYLGDRSSYDEWHRSSGRRGETMYVDSEFGRGLKRLLDRFFV